MYNRLLFFEDLSSEDTFKIRCTLCPHNCILTEDKLGACRLRTVKDSIPVSINYGEVTSAGIDPIEKKPLYHFMPSKNILSVGTFGCNMTCSFCQNYEISQNRPRSEFVSVDELIEKMNSIPDNIGIAFTYNEPFMWYEYVYEACKTIKERYKNSSKVLKTVLVTNGYVNKKPLEDILPYVDAMNIDLKAYTNTYYSRVCGAKLEPVLDTIKIASKKCHVEITTLLVSDENDSLKEVREISEFISNIDPDIPLHLSRYFPRYKMDNKPTEIQKLLDAQAEAKKYLKYVYIGNVAETDNNTYCPSCHEVLIKRNMYNTEVLIDEDKCPKCGYKINIKL